MANEASAEGSDGLMAYKIAAASSDGKVINQHFGRTGQFLIFEVCDEGRWSFAELRENIPPCTMGEHSEQAMQMTIDLISDCRSVLTARIGAGAQQALAKRGIEAYSVPDYIDQALDKLIIHYRRIDICK